MIWQGLNWKEACRLLACTHSEKWCENSKLKRVLPSRRYKKGTRPGVTGKGPLGPDSNDEIQWVFKPNIRLTKLEKDMVMGEIVRLGVETLFSTHVYSFGGKNYHQRDGGPIG